MTKTDADWEAGVIIVGVRSRAHAGFCAGIFYFAGRQLKSGKMFGDAASCGWFRVALYGPRWWS